MTRLLLIRSWRSAFAVCALFLVGIGLWALVEAKDGDSYLASTPYFDAHTIPDADCKLMNYCHGFCAVYYFNNMYQYWCCKNPVQEFSAHLRLAQRQGSQCNQQRGQGVRIDCDVCLVTTDKRRCVGGCAGSRAGVTGFYVPVCQ